MVPASVLISFSYYKYDTQEGPIKGNLGLPCALCTTSTSSRAPPSAKEAALPAASWDAWYAGTLITSRVDAAAPSLSTSPRRGEGNVDRKRAVFFLKGPGGDENVRLLHATYMHVDCTCDCARFRRNTGDAYTTLSPKHQANIHSQKSGEHRTTFLPLERCERPLPFGAPPSAYAWMWGERVG